MDRAASRLVDAVRSGETIGILGDYDVDGATSSALLLRFFTAVGARAVVYVPDRIKEGYGPSLGGVESFLSAGAKVMITVDCGITAFDVLDAAASAGLDVIVVDHHVAEPRLPRACAVVNPNRLDETSPHRHMAAVGLAFLLAIATSRALRAAGWYGADRPEPDLLTWLDLVALGTICDVVPLVGVNRALVAQGLKILGRRGNPGLAALGDVAGVKVPPGAYHAGFILGPRVNAGGRVGEADLGSRLLSTNDPAEAQRLARRLDELNLLRRQVEARSLDDAIAQVEAAPGHAVAFAAGEGWHPGVIGIIASRLVERFNRPACVVALDGQAGKGSGRSVPGVNLGAAVIAARQAGILSAGGGHPMAAGFTVPRGSLARFQEFLDERIGASIDDQGLVPTLYLDGALSLGAATLDLAATLARLEPFGAGNAEPSFALDSVRIGKADVVGENHVRCFLGDATGGRLKAIAFRAAGTPLGRALLDRAGSTLHLAGRLRLERWQEREDVQFMISDAAPARL
jgi:single-stranded-DNA-specific exonuclease